MTYRLVNSFEWHWKSCTRDKARGQYIFLAPFGWMNISTRAILSHGPLARYAKLLVVHALGMPETFSPPPRINDPDMHYGTCVTHVPWCMPGSLTCGFLWSRWRGKHSRHARRMRNPQFYVSGKRPMALCADGTGFLLLCHIGRWTSVGSFQQPGVVITSICGSISFGAFPRIHVCPSIWRSETVSFLTWDLFYRHNLTEIWSWISNHTHVLCGMQLFIYALSLIGSVAKTLTSTPFKLDMGE